MGAAYASTHKGLGRLAKIFYFADRLPYHIHQMKKDANLVGRNPKEEALLKKPDYRQRLAEALFHGVQRYAESLSHFQVAQNQ